MAPLVKSRYVSDYEFDKDGNLSFILNYDYIKRKIFDLFYNAGLSGLTNDEICKELKIKNKRIVNKCIAELSVSGQIERRVSKCGKLKGKRKNNDAKNVWITSKR